MDKKMLIEVRKEKSELTCSPSRMTVSAIYRTFFDPSHVYLIVGGLGGFGLELIQWMIGRGARNIMISSRRALNPEKWSGYQRRCVDFWCTEQNVNVQFSALNIGNEVSTKLNPLCHCQLMTFQMEAFQLVRTCLKFGPLGGVFHTAMVLNDRIFEDQTVEDFKAQANAKYHGTRNLDKATRELCPAMPHFVYFSSVSAGRGNDGQSSYGMANSSAERIIEWRRQDGYSGIAIQWGTIADTGIIFDGLHKDNNTVFAGTVPQRMYSCLATLEKFFGWNHPIVSW